jgi:hypothetical protein
MRKKRNDGARSRPHIHRKKGTVPMEFSNVILVIVGLGAAVLNPLFDRVAPKLAAWFGRRHAPKEPCECC